MFNAALVETLKEIIERFRVEQQVNAMMKTAPGASRSIVAPLPSHGGTAGPRRTAGSLLRGAAAMSVAAAGGGGGGGVGGGIITAQNEGGKAVAVLAPRGHIGPNVAAGTAVTRISVDKSR